MREHRTFMTAVVIDPQGLHIDVATPTTVRKLLQLLGIEEAPDLIAMDSDTVIARAQWDESRIDDQTTLTIMSAIEGG